jgi:hypothetical protein
MHLFSQIKDIKVKAEKSEEMVIVLSFSDILVAIINSLVLSGQRNNTRYKAAGRGEAKFNSIDHHSQPFVYPSGRN